MFDFSDCWRFYYCHGVQLVDVGNKALVGVVELQNRYSR